MEMMTIIIAAYDEADDEPSPLVPAAIVLRPAMMHAAHAARASYYGFSVLPDYSC